MEFVIMFITGVIVGCVVTAAAIKPRSIGTLKICDYDSDDGEPYLFLELRTSAADLYNKNYVTMEVKNISPK